MLKNPKSLQSAQYDLHLLGPLAAPAVPRLCQWLRESTDGQFQIQVAGVLGAIGPVAARSALPDLLAALKNPAATTGIASALARWGPGASEAVADLLAVLDSAGDHARGNIVSALGQIGPAARPAIEALKARLDDADSSVQARAAVALWRIDRRTDLAIPALIRIGQERQNSRWQQDWHACGIVAEFLGEMGEPARLGIPVLRQMLTHEIPSTRIHAARSLWHLEPRAEEILPVLLDALRSGGFDQQVIDYLAEMGPAARAAVPLLRQIIGTEDPLPEAAVPEDWLDSKEKVARAAVRALRAITDPASG